VERERRHNNDKIALNEGSVPSTIIESETLLSSTDNVLMHDIKIKKKRKKRKASHRVTVRETKTIPSGCLCFALKSHVYPRETVSETKEEKKRLGGELPWQCKISGPWSYHSRGGGSIVFAWLIIEARNKWSYSMAVMSLLVGSWNKQIKKC